MTEEEEERYLLHLDVKERSLLDDPRRVACSVYIARALTRGRHTSTT